MPLGSVGNGDISNLIMKFGTWGIWLESLRDRLTPQVRTPTIHWIGVWVDARANLDLLEKKGPLTLPSMKPWFLRHPTRNLPAIPNKSFRFGNWYTSSVFKNHFTFYCMYHTNCIHCPDNDYYNTPEPNIIFTGAVDFHCRYLHYCEVSL